MISPSSESESDKKTYWQTWARVRTLQAVLHAIQARLQTLLRIRDLVANMHFDPQ